MRKIDNPKWRDFFMGDALRWASRSKDPHTQVGAVIVNPDNLSTISPGYNGIPRGVGDLPERMTREEGEKYRWMAHAEENAISNAAFLGHSTRGATMFVTHQPCARCAGMIVNAGITHLVIGPNETTISDRERAAANTKFVEGGVTVTRILCEAV